MGSYIKLSRIHGGWCWFDMNISIGTHQIFINLISVQRGGIYLSDDVKKLQKFGILVCFYDFQNLRDPRKYCFYHPGLMGVMLVRHSYLNIFTSHFYNLGNSSKRSYLSFKWCKEIGKIRSFSMFLCLSKFAGSSKIWLILCGTHGGLVGST